MLFGERKFVGCVIKVNENTLKGTFLRSVDGLHVYPQNEDVAEFDKGVVPGRTI